MSFELTLHRVAIIPDGCFSVLLWQGIPFAVTGERTYPDGQRGTQIVKIAPGTYDCFRAFYNRGGYEVWQIVGGQVTRDRLIYFHKGNVEDDVDGCVAVGEQFGFLGGKVAVLRSGEGFKELMTLTADHDQLQLSVIN